NIKRVAQDLVALEFRFSPIGSDLLNLKRAAVPQIFAKPIDHFAENAIGFAFVHLIRTNLIDQIVDHVTQVHGIQHAESKINGELQPRLARGSFNSIAVFEQQHAEAVESGILQRETILGFVHSEAAGTA